MSWTGRSIRAVNSGIGQGTMYVSGWRNSSDVEVLILTLVCEQNEKNRNNEKRILMNDIFVSRYNEGEFHTLFRTLRQT
jgi:hypothetical protein